MIDRYCQIVIVSDGVTSFAGMYYEGIQWTRDDKAQMGFDAGDGVNFKAHPYSFSPNMRNLAYKQFLYKIRSVFPPQHFSLLVVALCYRKPTSPDMPDV